MQTHIQPPTLTSTTAPTWVDTSVEQSLAMTPLAVEVFGKTDRGKERATNEDQFLIATMAGALIVQQSSLSQQAVRFSGEQGHLFVVADGMGGHAGGEEASALAVDTLERFLLGTMRWLVGLSGAAGEGAAAFEEFKTALAWADEAVRRFAEHHPKLRGMGTTLTIAYSFGAQLFVAHAGDSRCYLYRGGRLYQITRDHTLAQQMIDAGGGSAQRTVNPDFRHIVTNVVGGGQSGVETEFHKVHLAPDDVLMLCTDGLNGLVTDEAIAGALASMRNPKDACKELVRMANSGGGTDNISVIVARYVASQASA